MHLTAPRPRGARALLHRLASDTSGLALLEFAFSMPLVLGMGMYALEAGNLALANLRVNQIALNLADNASRVGLTSPLSIQQIREWDINDVLQAARVQGSGIGLTSNGRIIISSLENVQQSYDSAPTQRIHWQRCVGLMSGTGYDSSYGTTSAAAGTDATSGNQGTPAPSGMGDPTALVNAPSGAGVMFVELNFKYKPLVTAYFVGIPRIHYVASFVVRSDKRDYAQIYNPTPAAPRSTCDKYSA
ncbi:TadE/TadG family type IV pilus assembly protein [Sphingomonas sp. TX0543]|uniref:TadE/TadG family type IV pilus assembly protein n=1 Tax=unclassified Sphingomonas TaxID=196159 RepID=UPI0010F85995|nr:hypothetical protein [Sphingomonas sp. 3P27F8]